MKSLIISFIFTAIVSSLYPWSVEAQSGFVPCVGTECNTCHLVEMGNTILNWLIGVLFVVFAAIVAVAGWGLVTSGGNQTALSDAKSKFTNAFIGLLIVMGAWLLVDTLMRGLLSPTTNEDGSAAAGGTIKGFGPWSQVQCVTPESTAWNEEEIDFGPPVQFAVQPSPGGNCPIGFTYDPFGDCIQRTGPVAPDAGGNCPVGYTKSSATTCFPPSAGSTIPPDAGGNCPPGYTFDPFGDCEFVNTPVPVASRCGFDESSLVSIPGEGSHRAVSSVASRYVNMRNAASAQGINLRINSSYRSDARQTQLWDGCTEGPANNCGGNVARPCSRGGGGSQHSGGVALDISSSGGRGERCAVRNLCRSAGASFIMFYSRSNHVHCDWGGRSGEVNVSC